MAARILGFVGGDDPVPDRLLRARSWDDRQKLTSAYMLTHKASKDCRKARDSLVETLRELGALPGVIARHRSQFCSLIGAVEAVKIILEPGGDPVIPNQKTG